MILEATSSAERPRIRTVLRRDRSPTADRDSAPGDAKRIGKHLNQLCVCSPFNGRGVETDEQGVVADASQTGTSRSRHDTNGDQDALFSCRKHSVEFLDYPIAPKPAGRSQL